MTLLLGTIALSLLFTGLVRRHALLHRVVDVPNARSMHSVPTPRGGGVAIVGSFLLACMALFWQRGALPGAVVALLAGGLPIALIGFVDDHGHVNAAWRLLVHVGAAVLALAALQAVPTLDAFGLRITPGLLAYVLGTLFIVWMLNLYNFMDGIDGIAGVEAITVLICAAWLLWRTQGPTESLAVILLLACATGGFLVWNLPPAKIFMGDGGSGFLGFAFAVLAWSTATERPAMFWSWLILLGVFIVDATTTLLRRLCDGRRLHEAHSSHAYQYAARRVRRHGPVTAAVAAINVGWLFPIAWLCADGWIDGALGTLIAYAPLCAAVLWLNAGKDPAPARVQGP